MMFHSQKGQYDIHILCNDDDINLSLTDSAAGYWNIMPCNIKLSTNTRDRHIKNAIPLPDIFNDDASAIATCSLLNVTVTGNNLGVITVSHYHDGSSGDTATIYGTYGIVVVKSGNPRPMCGLLL
jgi:hypothetical protein